MSVDEQRGRAAAKRLGVSRLLAIALVLTPWLGCGTKQHDFGPAVSDAGASAGGTAGETPDGEAGGSSTPTDCALTLCDGVCIDTTKDPQHCGDCSQNCTALPHLGTTTGVTCSDSACQIAADSCQDGYAHCTDDPKDGCETDVSSAANCGSCGKVCDGATPFCALGKCAASCPAAAPNECGSMCADFETDAMHCGDCSTVCASPMGGGNATCAAGKCGVACLGGFHQCPGTTDCAGNTDATRCGPDCAACEVPAGGHATCVNDACAIACDGGTKQCGELCIDTSKDVKNCGACGHDCTALPHVGSAEAVSCSAGKCVVPSSACATGFDHCSDNPDDGCETDTTKPEHCGGCTTKCPANNPLCTPQGCKNSCPASAPTLCDGTTCVDLNTDPKHCGDCATPCTQPASGGSTVCEAKKCALKCLNTYHPCGTSECASDTDKNKCGATCEQCLGTDNGAAQCTDNKCTVKCANSYHKCADETCRSNSDADHCEASCKACTDPANGSPQCSNNACTVACDNTYHKCPDNSCASDSNAAKCTKDCTQCTTANGTASCVANACVATACNLGFKLCGGKCVDPSLEPSAACGGQLLSAGHRWACGVKQGGVWCWGDETLSTPFQIPGLSNVTQVSVGNRGCALKSDGSIWCWALGPVGPPTDVSTEMKFRQVASEGDDVCAIEASNKVYCLNGLTWEPKGNFTATHVSKPTGSARASSGAIWSWPLGGAPVLQTSPAGSFAQVEGTETEMVLRSSAGGVLYGGVAVGSGELTGSPKFVQVSAGIRGGCALATDGRVGCWGYGPYGQLGDGTFNDSTTMVRFGGSTYKAVEVSHGQIWTCALKADHTVWCVGYHTPKQDGFPELVNIQLD